jgi:hypothetical protein
MKRIRNTTLIGLCALILAFSALAAEENPDSAWLSLDPSGYPVLEELDVEKGDTLVLHFMMKNAREVAHAFMVPLSYNDGVLRLLSASMDSTDFPEADHGAWQLVTKSEVERDTSKVMLYAFTISYAAGVPKGTHHLGRLIFEAVRPGRCIIDRTRFGYSGSVLYTNGPQAKDYIPNWRKVQ